MLHGIVGHHGLATLWDCAGASASAEAATLHVVACILCAFICKVHEAVVLLLAPAAVRPMLGNRTVIPAAKLTVVDGTVQAASSFQTKCADLD